MLEQTELVNVIFNCSHCKFSRRSCLSKEKIGGKFRCPECGETGIVIAEPDKNSNTMVKRTQVLATLTCTVCNYEKSATIAWDGVPRRAKCPKCNSISPMKFSEIIENRPEKIEEPPTQEEIEAPTVVDHIVHSDLNDKQRSLAQYTALFKRTFTQDPKTAFAFFPYRKKNGETWETPFLKLAALAKTEDWNFHRTEFRRPNQSVPILCSYLNYTFHRVVAQNKIKFVDSKAIFNTGLQTVDEKDIYAVFSKQDESLSPGEDWALDGWYDSYNQKITNLRPFPEIATYIGDASDLVLDLTYDIDVNIAHILDDPENQKRLPPQLVGERTLAMTAIKGATELLRQKCIRNYKTAIPFWYHPAEKIQLLLPLCLTSPDHADLALVADKDASGKVYRIRTALRMDMAYSNARLITRPDREWLNP